MRRQEIARREVENRQEGKRAKLMCRRDVMLALYDVIMICQPSPLSLGTRVALFGGNCIYYRSIANCNHIRLLFSFALIVGILFFFFFFQAEDGIRDDLVTGVQTCALPISQWRRSSPAFMEPECWAGTAPLRRQVNWAPSQLRVNYSLKGGKSSGRSALLGDRKSVV